MELTNKKLLERIRLILSIYICFATINTATAQLHQGWYINAEIQGGYNMIGVTNAINTGSSITTNSYSDDNFNWSGVVNYNLGIDYAWKKNILSLQYGSYNIKQTYYNGVALKSNSIQLQIRNRFPKLNLSYSLMVLEKQQKQYLYLNAGTEMLIDDNANFNKIKIRTNLDSNIQYNTYISTNYQTVSGVNFLMQTGLGYKRKLNERLFFNARFNAVMGFRNLTTNAVVFIITYPGGSKQVAGNSTGLNQGNALLLSMGCTYKFK